jgi:hypothetical protein
MIISKKISGVVFTTRDWNLYDYRGIEPALLARSKRAARELNKALTASVNSGLTRSQVEQALEVVMTSYRDTGATDSEPRNFLERQLNLIYG